MYHPWIIAEYTVNETPVFCGVLDVHYSLPSLTRRFCPQLPVCSVLRLKTSVAE